MGGSRRRLRSNGSYRPPRWSLSSQRYWGIAGGFTLSPWGLVIEKERGRGGGGGRGEDKVVDTVERGREGERNSNSHS